MVDHMAHETRALPLGVTTKCAANSTPSAAAGNLSINKSFRDAISR